MVMVVELLVTLPLTLSGRDLTSVVRRRLAVGDDSAVTALFVLLDPEQVEEEAPSQDRYGDERKQQLLRH